MGVCVCGEVWGVGVGVGGGEGGGVVVPCSGVGESGRRVLVAAQEVEGVGVEGLLAFPTVVLLPLKGADMDDHGGEGDTVVDRECKKGERDRGLERVTEGVVGMDAEGVKVGGIGVAVAHPEEDRERGTELVAAPVRVIDTEAEGEVTPLCEWVEVIEGGPETLTEALPLCPPVSLALNGVGVATGQVVAVGVGVESRGV